MIGQYIFTIFPMIEQWTRTGCW